MAENISPEERLFKVIQQGKQLEPASGAPEKKGFPGLLSAIRRMMSSGGPAVKPRTSAPGKSFDWKKIFPANLKFPEPKPGQINKALFFVLILMIAAVVYSLATKRQDAARITDAVSKIQISSAGGREKIEPFKALAHYLGRIQERNLFRPYPRGGVIESRPSEEVSASMQDIAASMKLQGIAWGEKPRAMILWQDDKEGKMYFLTKGQTIGSTNIKVKEIYRNKVVIGDDMEEMDLL
ncbi:MAG: hypothetical protein JXB40_05855 [Candidatus Omnitrophica bacterium]|nr:hypothetical protein [Candidatus Omnitrophota bacterium]